MFVIFRNKKEFWCYDLPKSDFFQHPNTHFQSLKWYRPVQEDISYFNVFRCSKTRWQSVPEGSWSTLICISIAGCCVLLCCTGRFSQQQNFPAWRLRFFSIPLQQFFFSRFRTIDSGKIFVASRPLSESNWNNLASRRKISSHIMLSIISTFECSFSWLCWGSLDDPAFFQDTDTEF